MPDVYSIRDNELHSLVEKCGEVLDRGGLVVLPTDTVYGLAARADISEAVSRVFQLKGRDEEKALVAMVRSLDEAVELATARDRDSLVRLGSLWPGPLTIVVEAAGIPWLDNVAPGSATIGIRVPNTPLLLKLLDRTGPLAVTSANPSGDEPPHLFTEVDARLLARVDAAVDGGAGGSGVPSTIVEITAGGMRIMREGAISGKDLARALKAGSGGAWAGEPGRSEDGGARTA